MKNNWNFATKLLFIIVAITIVALLVPKLYQKINATIKEYKPIETNT